MNPVMLWRLAGADTPPPDEARLAAGLKLHLQHTALTSVLVQIRDVQQAYVAVTGCADCVSGHCVPGCYSTLFRRLLRATWPAVTPQLVRRGFAPRPYTRAVLAWPTADAQPLASTLLHDWQEARLSLVWRMTRGGQLAVGALLAVDARGPTPQEVLATVGWRTWSLPRITHQRLLNTTSAILPAQRHWTGTVQLLAPSSVHEQLALVGKPSVEQSNGAGTVLPHQTYTNGHTTTTVHFTSVSISEPLATDSTALDDAALTTWLRETVLAAHATTEESTRPEMNETTNTDLYALTVPSEAPDADGRWWPQGPDGLPPDAVATLVTQIANDPRPNAPAQASQRGLSKNRLRDWFGLTEPQARIWTVWLDAAELLQPVAHHETRWTTTRPLVTNDVNTLAEQLRDTPVPEPRDLPAMWRDTP